MSQLQLMLFIQQYTIISISISQKKKAIGNLLRTLSCKKSIAKQPTCSMYWANMLGLRLYVSKLFVLWDPGGRLNKKDGLTRYGNSHVKDKTS